MDVASLQVFVEVVRRGNFAAVARDRGLTPSAVSRSIAGLEKELGIRLFQRSTRRLSISEAGRQYFERIEPVVEELGAGEAAAGSARLDTCFAPDAQLSFEFPPAYSALDFQASGTGAFVQHVLGIFQANGFVRTQHNVSNVVATRTGSSTATLRSSISGAHVFPDESVLNLTAMFADDVQREADGWWRITRRRGVVTSATHWRAFGQP